MNIILFDSSSNELWPLTLTRPVSELRVGITKISEKWEFYFKSEFSSLSASHLKSTFPLKKSDQNLLINGQILPNEDLVKQIKNLAFGEKLMAGEVLIAAWISKEQLEFQLEKNFSLHKIDVPIVKCAFGFDQVNYAWDVFSLNAKAIKEDFDRITMGRESAVVSGTNQLIGDQVFLEEGAKVECSILNSTMGPIYVGKKAEIMEGSIVRGALALCDSATLKMGAKIYGATTIGPHSKVGGEVSNCVIQGYTNKGHDGFIGNSVIGEWCNLGADTNCSNLKNNYGNVKAWNYTRERFENTGNQFLGLIMGDHSKCGINTMFNTGTVVGVFANVFGGEFPSKFIPSFSWGGARGFDGYKLDKAFEVAEKVMERRGIDLTASDKNLLNAVYKLTSKYRN